MALTAGAFARVSSDAAAGFSPSAAPAAASSACRHALIGFGILASSPNSARRSFASASSISSMSFFGSDGMLLQIRRQTIIRWKNFLRDNEQTIQTFAQPGADRFRIKMQFRSNLIVTQLAEVPQLDDLPAGLTQTIKAFPDEARGLGNLY